MGQHFTVKVPTVGIEIKGIDKGMKPILNDIDRLCDLMSRGMNDHECPLQAIP